MCWQSTYPYRCAELIEQGQQQQQEQPLLGLAALTTCCSHAGKCLPIPISWV